MMIDHLYPLFQRSADGPADGADQPRACGAAASPDGRRLPPGRPPSSSLRPLIGRRSSLPDDAIGYSSSPALWPLIGWRSFPAR
jgi:hypothetical protein